MVDLMIDFQTFGQDQFTCPIINCSLFAFEWDRFKVDPYSFEEIVKNSTTFKVSVKDQVVNHGYSIEESTVNFWEKQTPELRALIKPKKDDLSLSDFCKKINTFLSNSEKIDYWWSRNNTFDGVILLNAFKKAGNKNLMGEYLNTWKVRDIATHLDTKLDFRQQNRFIPVKDTEYWESAFQEHNSKHELAADLMRMQTMFMLEHDMEMLLK